MGVLIVVLILLPVMAGITLVADRAVNGDWFVKRWNRAGIDRRQSPEEAGAYDTNPPQELDYNYIEWLEARLKVGKFDPDLLEITDYDVSTIEGSSLRAEVIRAKRQRQQDLVNAMMNKREDIRRSKAEQLERERQRNIERLDHATGKFKTGGVLRTYIDKDGNQTTIRSWGA